MINKGNVLLLVASYGAQNTVNVAFRRPDLEDTQKCHKLYSKILPECTIFPPPLWRCGQTRVKASSFFRLVDHTQRRSTVGRTPLDVWSARRRDLYLTTHNTHNRQTSRWDSNPQSQLASGRRPTPYTARPLGPECVVFATIKAKCKYWRRSYWMWQESSPPSISFQPAAFPSNYVKLNKLNHYDVGGGFQLLNFPTKWPIFFESWYERYTNGERHNIAFQPHMIYNNNFLNMWTRKLAATGAACTWGIENTHANKRFGTCNFAIEN